MKHFLHGRKAAAEAMLRSSAGHPQPAAVGLASHTSSEPGIEVVKQGDKIVRLVITCSCGEKMEVECLYTAGS